MLPPNLETITKIVDAFSPLLASSNRLVIGLAGPPASGKSMLGDDLVAHLNAHNLERARLIPMDGFHLDNHILSQRNLLARKGAPFTFDFYGLRSLIERVRDVQHIHYAPIFDRKRDLAIAGAHAIPVDTEIVVVEGNYLLLDQAPWHQLKPLFDFTIFIQTPIDVLKSRLIERWINYGHDAKMAEARALGNDMPNALLIAENSLKSDFVVRQAP